MLKMLTVMAGERDTGTRKQPQADEIADMAVFQVKRKNKNAIKVARGHRPPTGNRRSSEREKRIDILSMPDHLCAHRGNKH